MEDCIFCKIVENRVPAVKLFEDMNCLSFLDKFPVTKAQALVIPKRHIDYVFDVPEEDYSDMFSIAKKVAKAIDKALSTKRTWLLIQGMDVPHAHIKILPIYEGIYLNLSEQRGKEASDQELKEIAEQIKQKLI